LLLDIVEEVRGGFPQTVLDHLFAPELECIKK